MKKAFFCILFLVPLQCSFSQFSTIIGGIKYNIDGELICSSAANPWNNEQNDKIHIDCYAYFRSDTLIYSQVTTENGVVQRLEIYSIALVDLDLNKAKIDWEKDFYSDNEYGMDKRLDISVKNNLEKVSYTMWNGNTRPYKTYFHKELKLNFVEESNAKEFLKKLKLRVKQLKK